MIFSGANQVIPTRYNGIRVTQALLGQPIPMLWGTRRLAGKLFWYGDFKSSVATNGGKKGGGSGGGGGKKGGQQYVYSASVIAGLCMGPCSGLLSVWGSLGEFQVESVTENFVVPSGGGSYTVSEQSNFAVDIGVSKSSPFNATVNDFGSPGPIVLSGTQQIPFTPVTGTPGKGEYSLTNGTYLFSGADAGASLAISYTAYRWVVQELQTTVVPFQAPFSFTVENQPYFRKDLGVSYYPSGTALTAVGGTPTLAGTYNPNGGNYLFAPPDAGLGITIKYSFNEPNTNANAPNTLNIELALGTQGQEPWAYLTSRHPGEALGYTEIAYIASSALFLGYVPELPNYSYEIVGPRAFGAGNLDACPSDCIQDALTSTTLRGKSAFPAAFIDSSLQGVARQFWLANNFFISPLVESRVTLASLIGEWLEAGQVANFWSEGLMKFIPYGTSSAIANGAQYTPPTQPIVSLSDFDFQAGKNEAPLKVSRAPWQDAYNRVNVQWTVRSNNYNSDVTPEQNDAQIFRNGLRPEGVKAFDFICELPAAQFAANMRLQRFTSIRNTYNFRLSHSYSYLEPMDIVEITDSAIVQPNTAVRIIKIIDDPKKGLEITAEDFPWASGSPSLYNKQAIESSGSPLPGQQTPGDTELLLIETPNPQSLTQGSILSIFATGKQSTWGGCILYKAMGTHSAQVNFVQVASNVLTVTGSNNLVAGDIVTFFNVQTATFLNGKSVTVISASPGSFTAAFTFANYGGSIGIADSGTAWAMTPFVPFQQNPIIAPARLGVLAPSDDTSPSTYALPAFSGTNPEVKAGTSPAVMEHAYVDLVNPGSTLSGISSAAASGPYPVTLSAIITDGVPELLSYQNATIQPGSLQPGSRYKIDTLYRGLLGTAGAQHNAGDLFVRMDDASATFEYDPSLYGQTIFIQACSFNLVGDQQQNLGAGVIIPIELQGNAFVGGSAAHLSYRPLSNPLTAVNAGSFPEVIIAPFSMRVAGITPDIQYNGGSIDCSSTLYGHLVYIYFDDPALRGGTVTYVATTSKETALQGLGRMYVGSITLPSSSGASTIGNNDGGSGAQSGLITIIPFSQQSTSVAGNGVVTNPANALSQPYSQSSFAALTATGNGSANTAELILSVPAAFYQRFSSVQAKCIIGVPTNSISGGSPVFQARVGIDFSPFGENIAVVNAGVVSGITLYQLTFALPSTTNISVQNIFFNLNLSSASVSGNIEVDVYGGWLECTS